MTFFFFFFFFFSTPARGAATGVDGASKSLPAGRAPVESPAADVGRSVGGSGAREGETERGGFSISDSGFWIETSGVLTGTSSAGEFGAAGGAVLGTEYSVLGTASS